MDKLAIQLALLGNAKGLLYKRRAERYQIVPAGLWILLMTSECITTPAHSCCGLSHETTTSGLCVSSYHTTAAHENENTVRPKAIRA